MSNFSGLALTRMEMKKVKGGLCTLNVNQFINGKYVTWNYEVDSVKTGVKVAKFVAGANADYEVYCPSQS